MAEWDALTIDKVVRKINNHEYVLPVIQRKLVWSKEQMERLFDSVLKKISFGGIIVIHDLAESKPLFPFRYFSDDGEISLSKWGDDTLTEDIDIVVDGQQRLQTFYIGLKGCYQEEELFFNLFSEEDDFEFSFARSEADLPQTGSDDGEGPARNLWIRTSRLYEMLLKCGGAHSKQADRVISEKTVTDDLECQYIRKNVEFFYMAIFDEKCVGVATIALDRSGALDDEANQEKVVELFTRLNNGGTKLSSFDLVASKMKSYSAEIEEIFREVEDYTDLGIDQDRFIRLALILQDIHSRTVAQVEKSDTQFVIDHWEKIKVALSETRRFLQAAGLEDYFKKNTTVIPLYFITYFFFYQAKPGDVVKNYELSSDFINLKRWTYLVLLNRVYESGRRIGWVADKTGIRKTIDCIKQYKGTAFPSEAMVQVYHGHGLNFHEEITSENINAMNWNFLFSLVYGKKQTIRQHDLDHIQPKSRLIGTYGWDKIGHVANFALMSSEVNRGAKSDTPLDAWIASLNNKDEYISSHLIPNDPELWKINCFEAFLTERTRLLIEKIAELIPSKIDHQPEPVAVQAPVAVEPEEESTRTRLARNWQHKMELVERYGYKEAFENLHAATKQTKLWVTPRERALLYHHNGSGQKILMTIWFHETGIWVNIRLSHFPSYYQNTLEELQSLLWDGGKWFNIPDIPKLTEKLSQLRTR